MGRAAGTRSDSWQGIPRGPESVALPVGWLVVVARASASLHVALRPHSGLARFASLATRAPGAMSGGDLWALPSTPSPTAAPWVMREAQRLSMRPVSDLVSIF